MDHHGFVYASLPGTALLKGTLSGVGHGYLYVKGAYKNKTGYTYLSKFLDAATFISYLKEPKIKRIIANSLVSIYFIKPLYMHCDSLCKQGCTVYCDLLWMLRPPFSSVLKTSVEPNVTEFGFRQFRQSLLRFSCWTDFRRDSTLVLCMKFPLDIHTSPEGPDINFWGGGHTFFTLFLSFVITRLLKR